MSVAKFVERIKVRWMERGWFKQRETLEEVAMRSHHEAVRRGEKEDV